MLKLNSNYSGLRRHDYPKPWPWSHVTQLNFHSYSSRFCHSFAKVLPKFCRQFADTYNSVVSSGIFFGRFWSFWFEHEIRVPKHSHSSGHMDGELSAAPISHINKGINIILPLLNSNLYFYFSHIFYFRFMVFCFFIRNVLSSYFSLMYQWFTRKMYFLVYFYVYGVSCDVSHPNFFRVRKRGMRSWRWRAPLAVQLVHQIKASGSLKIDAPDWLIFSLAFSHSKWCTWLAITTYRDDDSS